MAGKREIKMNTDFSKEREINSSMTFLLLKYGRSFKYILRSTNWRGVVISTHGIYFNIFSLAEGHILTTEYSTQKEREKKEQH